MLFPKCRSLQIAIGQKLFQWFQQLSQNSNTSCQKYPPRSQNKKVVNIHLQWWTEHQATLSLKVHHLKPILLNYSIWWLIHSFTQKTWSEDPKICLPRFNLSISEVITLGASSLYMHRYIKSNAIGCRDQVKITLSF